VHLALLDRKGSPSIPESGVTATSRVPNGLRVLREMVQGIEDKENEASRKEIDFEVSHVINLCRVQPKVTENRSASREYIQLSNVSAWDETGDGGLPNSYSHAGQEFNEPNIPSDVLHADSDGELELEGRSGSNVQNLDHAFMLSQDFTMVCSFYPFRLLACSRSQHLKHHSTSTPGVPTHTANQKGKVGPCLGSSICY
jgi:hypothetical protein